MFVLYVLCVLAACVGGTPEDVATPPPRPSLLPLHHFDTTDYPETTTVPFQVIGRPVHLPEGEGPHEIMKGSRTLPEGPHQVTKGPVTVPDLTTIPAVVPTRFTAVKDTMAVVEEEPYFDASMASSYTGYLGKTVTLTCIVHAAKTDKSVSWIRGRDLRILTVGGYTYTTDLRFEAFHQPASTEWSLRIRSVQPRDAGAYECQVATKPIRTFNASLKVVEPTVEVVGAPDIHVNTASMINLTCIVYHAPYPPKDITWYHGNQTISYTSPRGGVSVVEERGETTTSILLLQNARPTDSGTFTCQPEGMDAAQVTLHVLDGERQRQLAIQTSGGCGGPAMVPALVLAATTTLALATTLTALATTLTATLGRTLTTTMVSVTSPRARV